MPFVFNRDFARKKQAEKLHEAEIRKNKIFAAYPPLASLDSQIKERKMILRGAILYKLSKEEIAELEKELAFFSQKYKAYLLENNIPENFSQPYWDCEICQDRGEILTLNGYKPCQCREKTFLQLMQKDSGLPARYFSANFANANLRLYSEEKDSSKHSPRLRAEKAFLAAKNFVDLWPHNRTFPGLIYDGAPGSGKTYLLACIANGIMAQGIEVQYINYNNFLYSLKMTFNANYHLSEYEIIEKILSAPLLIIDDLGTEMATDFSSSTLFRIVDQRYAEEMPLIVSTSIPTNDLRIKLGYLGEKIVQRIIESCNHHILTGDVRQSVIARRLSKDD